MKKPVGETLIALDCRVEANRTRESNIGSFLADIVRTEYDADIGLLCGGKSTINSSIKMKKKKIIKII